MKYIANIAGKEYAIEVVDERHISVDGKMLDVDFASVSGQPVFSLIVDGKSYEAYVNPGDEHWEVLLHGRLFSARVEDEREMRLRAAGSARIADTGEFHLKAPMPGLVVAIPVAEGQQVEKGQVLVVLESMKMQNELKAPREGTVARIRVKIGETVEQRATMLSIV
jgi:biotin carboxyl carrier protein